MRTSHTHPLQIAPLPCPGGGMDGITSCSGKWQKATATGAWGRDLTLVVKAVAARSATLVTGQEMQALRVAGLSTAEGMT